MDENVYLLTAADPLRIGTHILLRAHVRSTVSECAQLGYTSKEKLNYDRTLNSFSYSLFHLDR